MTDYGVVSTTLSIYPHIMRIRKIAQMNKIVRRQWVEVPQYQCSRIIAGNQLNLRYSFSSAHAWYQITQRPYQFVQSGD
tara:strand:- start:516 stop:752 length:237 start_codon:yes stop_codon:yes gene_type:complete